MKKQLLLLIPIAMLLTCCSIRRDTTSSLDPSSSSQSESISSGSTIITSSESSDTSIKPDPSSSSIVPPITSSSTIPPSPTSSSSEGPVHQHIPEDAWSYDDTNHWHECVEHDGYKFNVDAHSLNEEIVTQPTYSTSGLKRVYCTICPYTYNETIPALGYEKCCDDMNNEIKDKEFFDVFEIKDYLKEKGFDPELNFETNKFFGFDNIKKKVVIYTVSGGISYPNDCKVDGNNYISFQVKEVSTLAQIRMEMIAINTGSNYSTLKLTSDITLSSDDSRIAINISKPIQFDLNNHTIGSSTFKGYSFYVNSESAVSIINGKIQTLAASGYDQKVSPSCICVNKALTFRTTDCSLECRAERGYCFIDDFGAKETKIKINNVQMNAALVAVGIQCADYLVIDSKINGVISINGGKTVINNCEVVAKYDFGAYEKKFVDNNTVYGTVIAYVNDLSGVYDTAIFSTTDAITVFDRRSNKSSYSLASVAISNSKLTSYALSGTNYGYGFRYIDFNNDPMKTSGSKSAVSLSNNVYVNCDGEASENPGGYSYATY